MLCLTASCLLPHPLTAKLEEPSAEDTIKAAMLYRFLFFVDNNTTEKQTYRIGITDDTNLYQAFEAMPRITKDQINIEIILITPESTRDTLATLDLIYCNCDFLRQQNFYQKLNNLPILTVTSEEDCFDNFGIIYLKKVKERYRFEIHETRARARNLKIDAKLLKLATEVHQ